MNARSNLRRCASRRERFLLNTAYRRPSCGGRSRDPRARAGDPRDHTSQAPRGAGKGCARTGSARRGVLRKLQEGDERRGGAPQTSFGRQVSVLRPTQRPAPAEWRGAECGTTAGGRPWRFLRSPAGTEKRNRPRTVSRTGGSDFGREAHVALILGPASREPVQFAIGPSPRVLVPPTVPPYVRSSPSRVLKNE